MNRESLAGDIWRACDILRRDDGTTGIMEYMEQLSWLLFLKAFEDIEDGFEEENSAYERIIHGPYRWSVWTGSRRRRAEEKVAEARQSLNRALALLERVRQSVDSSTADSASHAGNKSTKAVSTQPQASTGASQALANAEAAVGQWQDNLQSAQEELKQTLVWLKGQAASLYDEHLIDQQVRSVIVRQFGTQIDLTPAQLEIVRENEMAQGEVLARKLAEGLKEQDLVVFVDNRLFPYLRHLDGSLEKRTISSIFNEIPGNRIRSADNLRDVVALLNGINFQGREDTQIVSQIYEDLLYRLGTEGGIAGEFYTPRRIIRFIVEVIDPQIGETVYDPFCGSAGFLVEAYKHMLPHAKSDEDHEILQKHTFYGQEKKSLAALLGVMNMILHGVLTPRISRANTLENEDVRNIAIETQHSIILTNPPFGGKEGQKIQRNFPVQNNATELLALQYIMSKMRPDGRCGVVVPDGILFRDDSFVNVRKTLLEEFNLFAIVSLPVGVFANVTSTGAGPKTSILLFEGLGSTNQVWYYQVRQVGYTLTKAQRPIQQDDLPDVLDMLGRYRQSVRNGTQPLLHERCWIVTLDEIKERGYDLSPRNPNNFESDYSQSPPEVMLADMLAKQQRLGEILTELQDWLNPRESTAETVNE
jgi:type I restriction enzyme M protein